MLLIRLFYVSERRFLRILLIMILSVSVRLILLIRLFYVSERRFLRILLMRLFYVSERRLRLSWLVKRVDVILLRLVVVNIGSIVAIVYVVFDDVVPVLISIVIIFIVVIVDKWLITNAVRVSFQTGVSPIIIVDFLWWWHFCHGCLILLLLVEVRRWDNFFIIAWLREV